MEIREFKVGLGKEDQKDPKEWTEKLSLLRDLLVPLVPQVRPDPRANQAHLATMVKVEPLDPKDRLAKMEILVRMDCRETRDLSDPLDPEDIRVTVTTALLLGPLRVIKVVVVGRYRAIEFMQECGISRIL